MVLQVLLSILVEWKHRLEQNGKTEAGKVLKGYVWEPLTSGDGLKNAAKAAATIGAGAMGLGMGDVSSAVSVGMAAYGISNSIDGAIQEHKNNLQLEKNEEVYDQNVEDYIEKYRELTGDTDIPSEQIVQNLTELMDQVDNGTIDWDKMKKNDGDDLYNLKQKFLKNSYAELRKSYEAAGGEKPSDLAKAHTTNKSLDKYKQKHGN